MSSKLRLDDLVLDYEDHDSDYHSEEQGARQRKKQQKNKRRKPLDDYMAQRAMKRQLSEPFEHC
ncbi:hypothetical protein [uncultured Neptuniibacter sp.]|uniref:hypothetical protein n=1 Tax=uncultured Neptuniibacter sp. TaxID=502143 RepID=UPI00260F9949|nr:hypothetical protein [uncultured Neptuniibacter sp.]